MKNILFGFGSKYPNGELFSSFRSPTDHLLNGLHDWSAKMIGPTYSFGGIESVDEYLR